LHYVHECCIIFIGFEFAGALVRLFWGNSVAPALLLLLLLLWWTAHRHGTVNGASSA
jgi:hypothetical protein